MNNFPLVSIIIPCYNHEKYVRYTLDSVIEDTYPNKEILIINDGSKDTSDLIIKTWINDHKVDFSIVYKYQENAGVCKTLNELIDLSKGKYLLPLASDDILIPGTILERVEFLENKPEKMVLITDAIVIDNFNKIKMNSSIIDYNKGDKRKFDNDESILLSTLTNPQISGPSTFIRKDVYDIIGRYRENLIAEDWYFYQRAAAANLMVFMDKICGKYRVHSNNSSGDIMKGSYKMAKTIVLTYWYNWYKMPKVRFKLIALKEMFKWFLRCNIYKFRT